MSLLFNIYGGHGHIGWHALETNMQKHGFDHDIAARFVSTSVDSWGWMLSQDWEI